MGFTEFPYTLSLLSVLLRSGRAALADPISMLPGIFEAIKCTAAFLRDTFKYLAMREMRDLPVRFRAVYKSAHDNPPFIFTALSFFSPQPQYISRCVRKNSPGSENRKKYMIITHMKRQTYIAGIIPESFLIRCRLLRERLMKKTAKQTTKSAF
jgi:hypothetical protein